MTTDRTLRVSGGLTRARSVLSRAERIAYMLEQGQFDPKTQSPLGLRKTDAEAGVGGGTHMRQVKEALQRAVDQANEE